MLPLQARVRRSLRLVGIPRSAPRGQGTSGILTRREHEVMTLVASGLSLAEVARRLGLGRPTVRRIADNARVKLGAHHRLSAVAALHS
ncbi:MAG: hypothetical protein GC156_01280 [Actinomycetales bacterium]|nr:hypothetical protein [Actinomycetales bacterium]